MTDLTRASFDLMNQLRRDAIWDDESKKFGDLAMFAGDLTAEQRGNFSDLKAKGLIVYSCADSDGDRNYDWHKIDMVTMISKSEPDPKRDLPPKIEITIEQESQTCQSCGARNYGMRTARADVEELVELLIGNSATVLCYPCVDVLRRSSHEALLREGA